MAHVGPADTRAGQRLAGPALRPARARRRARLARATRVAELGGPAARHARRARRPALRLRGCSIGGAIGAELALRHPHRVASLALVAASPRFGTADEFRQRGVIVRANGTGPDGALRARALVHRRLRRRPARHRGVGRADGPHHRPRLLHRGLRGARRLRHPRRARPDHRAHARPGRRRGPGDRARPTPARWSRAYPDARLAVVPGASHLAPVEQPAAVTDLLVRHFSTAWQDTPDPTTSTARRDPVPPQARAARLRMVGPRRRDRRPPRQPRRRARRAPRTRTSAGMRIRREVLGDAHVDARDGRGRRASAATSRSSSPATPGARCGPGTGSTGVPAAAVTLTALVAGGHLDELAVAHPGRAAQRAHPRRDQGSAAPDRPSTAAFPRRTPPSGSPAR